MQQSRALDICIENVSFAFPDNPKNLILKNISMEVEQGTMVAIIGPSGAGKTTLASVILGLARVSEGTVRIAGSDPQEFVRANPGAVSLVQQESNLILGSVAENIALGVPKLEVNRASLGKAIVNAQLSEWVENLPQGIDTLIHAGSVSGGQLQRLGLARALYTSPGLLILDEPTSSLDADTENRISSALRSLRGTITQVVIAHRLTTIQDADKVFLIEDGRIAAADTFERLRSSSPTVARQVELLTFRS